MTAVLAWLRGLLAVGLLGGFYALAFVLIAVDAVFVVLVLWAAFYDPTRGGSWTLAVGGSIPAVFALIYGVATVSRPEEQPIGAVPVLRREAPGLWRLVCTDFGHMILGSPARGTPDHEECGDPRRRRRFGSGRSALIIRAPGAAPPAWTMWCRPSGSAGPTTTRRLPRW